MARQQGWFALVIALAIAAAALLFTSPLQLGLDLRGGSQITVEVQPAGEIKRVGPEQMEAVKLVLDRRVNGLGVAEDMLGNYQSAARWYGMALDAGGERPMVINNAGYSLIMAGQYREAEQLLRRAVARYPDQHRLNHNLAIAQARMGDYPQAVLTWQRSQDRAVALSNAGYIALLNGDREQARRMFEDANRSATSHRPKIAANLASVTDTSP